MTPSRRCLYIVLVLVLATTLAHAAERAMFSPRMDYEEWTPLGRGDPLKNDPTYDYVPPVLDRVNYWLEPEARTPDPPTSTSASAGKRSPGKFEAKKSDHSDLRRDDLDSLMNLINERSHSVRLTPQYIPLQSGYQVYIHQPTVMRPPHTMLMPPPLPPVTSKPPPSSLSHATAAPQTTATPNITEATTFATHDTSPSTASQIHKVLAPVIDIHPDGEQSLSSSLLHLILQNEVPTPQPPLTTTSSTTPHPALTTDPLFSHYKQPAEPLHGPMYLIIQGHSKVKTYGPSKLDKLSGIPIQDSNEVEERQRKGRGVEVEDLVPVDEAFEAVIKDYVDDSYDEGASGSSLNKLFFALNSR